MGVTTLRRRHAATEAVVEAAAVTSVDREIELTQALADTAARQSRLDIFREAHADWETLESDSDAGVELAELVRLFEDAEAAQADAEIELDLAIAAETPKPKTKSRK
jgi:3-deoxy-D-manno-octulosonic acid (KDO) 8-phosphate synthase